jgi:hypothetical protein
MQPAVCGWEVAAGSRPQGRQPLAALHRAGSPATSAQDGPLSLEMQLYARRGARHTTGGQAVTTLRCQVSLPASRRSSVVGQ